MLWRLLKTLLFTVLVPGGVAGYIPWSLIHANSPGARIASQQWCYLGVVPLALGIAIYLRCAWDFAVIGLGTPAPIDPPRALVEKNLYRFVRNPMYFGVLCVITGQGVLFASRPVFFYFAILWIFFHLFVMLYEEPALRRHFGAQYDDYCRRVPRWLPRFPAS